jgi:hypothetical protein
MPSGEEGPEGRTDACPMHIKQGAIADFERLLGFLYPLRVDFLYGLARPLTQQLVYSRTTDYQIFADILGEAKWISILCLSHRWQMPNTRSLAIEKLQDLSLQ